MLIYIVFKSGENIKPCIDLPGDWKFVSSRQKIAINKLYSGSASYAGSSKYYEQAEQHLRAYFTQYDPNFDLEFLKLPSEII